MRAFLFQLFAKAFAEFGLVSPSSKCCSASPLRKAYITRNIGRLSGSDEPGRGLQLTQSAISLSHSPKAMGPIVEPPHLYV